MQTRRRSPEQVEPVHRPACQGHGTTKMDDTRRVTLHTDDGLRVALTPRPRSNRHTGVGGPGLCVECPRDTVPRPTDERPSDRLRPKYDGGSPPNPVTVGSRTDEGHTMTRTFTVSGWGQG